ncbi:hypothetical protein [Anaerocellum danielii]|uniref:PIN domain-containing protein n=1 Tax=Anaerocellum danielii TaxID=1387557 RepID=A0ABZ0U2J9_9FIRM|nr:hypothetical protein [Caldicellulosiruptor danielii]WPX08833.1 hypothetical protein SOJ16_002748 [Caldicellulosiruptor danielii]
MIKKRVDILENFLLSLYNANICLIDNNSIEFLTYVIDKIPPKKIFTPYDVVLIPTWVWEEICDSPHRKNYAYKIGNSSKYLHIINEYDYVYLVDHKEAELFRLFTHACYVHSILYGFLKKDIQCGKPLEELPPYKQWLKLFDNQALKGSELSTGRKQRKNGGEIFITVLTYILACYYSSHIANITIISHDRDTYRYVKTAAEKIEKDEIFKNKKHCSITSKSNDCLLYEWKKLGYMSSEEIEVLVHKHRQARRVKFTRRKEDNSIEEKEIILDNIQFLVLIKDNDVHIIF